MSDERINKASRHIAAEMRAAAESAAAVTPEQRTRSDYEAQASAIVRRLRQLADEVERSVQPKVNIVSRRLDYPEAAAAAVHAVTWAVPNLHLSDLVLAAAEVDRALVAEAER